MVECSGIYVWLSCGEKPGNNYSNIKIMVTFGVERDMRS